MSLHRFFLNNQVLAEEKNEEFALRLSTDDVRHARALRLSPGEHIAIIDASTDYFECEVVSFDDDLWVRICGHSDVADAGAQVVLLQGLAKGDKFDDVVRHASEIGVAAFVPLLCERSIVKLDEKKTATRMARWEAIAKSAAMQAGLNEIPEISNPLSVREATEFLRGATCVLVCWEEARGLSLKSALHSALIDTFTMAIDARVAVVVGPEGGLTEEEVSTLLACNKHAYAVTLGKNILRTETAGLIAPALAMYELGGLQ